MFPDARGLFIGPDLILHVHDRWMRGTADEKVTRTFGIRDSRKAPRFVMMGSRAVVDYLDGWSFADVVPSLRRLPSLASLEDGFWDYLSALRFRGSIKGVEDGTCFDRPVTPSEYLLRWADARGLRINGQPCS